MRSDSIPRQSTTWPIRARNRIASCLDRVVRHFSGRRWPAGLHPTRTVAVKTHPIAQCGNVRTSTAAAADVPSFDANERSEGAQPLSLIDGISSRHANRVRRSDTAREVPWVPSSAGDAHRVISRRYWSAASPRRPPVSQKPGDRVCLTRANRIRQSAPGCSTDPRAG